MDKKKGLERVCVFIPFLCGLPSLLKLAAGSLINDDIKAANTLQCSAGRELEGLLKHGKESFFFFFFFSMCQPSKGKYIGVPFLGGSRPNAKCFSLHFGSSCTFRASINKIWPFGYLCGKCSTKRAGAKLYFLMFLSF